MRDNMTKLRRTCALFAVAFAALITTNTQAAGLPGNWIVDVDYQLFVEVERDPSFYIIYTMPDGS